MTKTAKLAGVTLQLNFAVEDEDGDVETILTQPINIVAKAWRTGWASEASNALIADAIERLTAPPAPEITKSETNGSNRAQRRQAVRKK